MENTHTHIYINNVYFLNKNIHYHYFSILSINVNLQDEVRITAYIFIFHFLEDITYDKIYLSAAQCIDTCIRFHTTKVA